MKAQTPKQAALNWWQDISNIEAHEAMKLAGYYGHDQCVNEDEILEMWIAAGSPLVETEEEITEQFCNLVNRPQIVDVEIQSSIEAKEIFEKIHKRKPDFWNKTDNLTIAAIRLGIAETYIKYKLL